jgi:hypothetical protein
MIRQLCLRRDLASCRDLQWHLPNVTPTANIFEPAALVAIAVYALIGWGAVVLIRIRTAPRGTKPAAS